MIQVTWLYVSLKLDQASLYLREIKCWFRLESFKNYVDEILTNIIIDHLVEFL